MKPEDEFKKCVELIAHKSPAVYLFMKQFEIVYVDEEVKNEQYGLSVLASALKDRIELYKGWMNLSVKDKAGVLVHEAYHIMLRHPFRGKGIIDKYSKEGYDPMMVQIITNLAMDSKINMNVNASWGTKFPIFFDDYDYVKVASVEEIVEKCLEENKQKMSMRTMAQATGNIGLDVNDGSSNEKTRDKSKETVLNEGTEEMKSGDEEIIERKVVEAIVKAKTVGANLTAIESQILDEVLKPKVDWRNMIKADIVSYIGKNVISTWSKDSRRADGMPGSKYMDVPRLYILVDVSGSVWDMISVFLSEIYHIAKDVSEINIITWDTAVTGEYRINKKEDIFRIEVKGCGGTRIVPVLEKMNGRIKPNDFVIIFTDTYWYDVEKARKCLNVMRAYKILAKTIREESEVDKEFNRVVIIDE